MWNKFRHHALGAIVAAASTSAAAAPIVCADADGDRFIFGDKWAIIEYAESGYRPHYKCHGEIILQCGRTDLDDEGSISSGHLLRLFSAGNEAFVLVGFVSKGTGDNGIGVLEVDCVGDEERIRWMSSGLTREEIEAREENLRKLGIGFSD